jgi:hypothetical protein
MSDVMVNLEPMRRGFLPVLPKFRKNEGEPVYQ